MGMIDTQLLSPGMIIDADVVDHTGRVVLPAGTILDDKHRRIFRMWGIAEVHVRESENSTRIDDVSEQLDSSTLESSTSAVKALFRHCNLNHVVMQQLFQIAVKKISQQTDGGKE
jgi:hypothetical protein